MSVTEQALCNTRHKAGGSFLGDKQVHATAGTGQVPTEKAPYLCKIKTGTYPVPGRKYIRYQAGTKCRLVPGWYSSASTGLVPESRQVAARYMRPSCVAVAAVYTSRSSS